MANAHVHPETQEERLIEEHGYDDHFHEHHHGDKFQSNFLTTYIFSQDHKIIARQFLITGMIWAIIGGLMSLVFRLQLGFPDESLAWLKPVLGKWITVSEAGVGTLSQEFYYALVTMHGTIIVFFVLTAGLSGTFSNLLIPLQVGARDMASPFLNMLSYWFFFLASVVMFASLFLSTGPFAGGWTAYPPLSALPQASDGSGTGMTLWIISLVFFVVSVLLGGINYITTVLNLRTKGMSMWRMPLTIWAFFVTAILGLLSFPVLASGFFLLMFDRGLGTSFYLSEIFIGGQALDHVGGSPILAEPVELIGQALDDARLERADVVVILTAHAAVDYDRARVLIALGRDAEAVEALRRSLSEEWYAPYGVLLVETLVRLGRLDEALDELERMLKLAPDQPPTH